MSHRLWQKAPRASLGMLAVFTLLTTGVAQAAPGNDGFAQALEISLPFEQTLQIEDATLEAGEPLSSCPTADTLTGSVWYSFTPAADTVIRVNVYREAYLTLVAVYSGDAVDALEEIGCNTQGGWQYESRVGFQATAGVTYRIQVGHIAMPSPEDGEGGLPLPAPEEEPPGPAEISVEVGGLITGTVTGPGGAPLVGACVSLFDVSGSWIDSLDTDGAGDYAAVVTNPGAYKLHFIHCPDPTLVSEWYDDAADVDAATPVGVSLGSVTSGIDVELEPSPDIVAETAWIETAPDAPGGWSGVVHLTVTNAGNKDSGWVGIQIEACSSLCRVIGDGGVTIPAGDSVEVEVFWDATGMVGNFTFLVSAWPEADPLPGNNSLVLEHSFVADAGVGLDTLCLVGVVDCI